MFFGGVHGAMSDAQHTTSTGAGDPRRGGVTATVYGSDSMNESWSAANRRFSDMLFGSIRFRGNQPSRSIFVDNAINVQINLLAKHAIWRMIDVADKFRWGRWVDAYLCAINDGRRAWRCPAAASRGE